MANTNTEHGTAHTAAGSADHGATTGTGSGSEAVTHITNEATETLAEHGVAVDPHAAKAHAAEGDHGAHGADGAHHGRPHLTHPPEPPHAIEIWYKLTKDEHAEVPVDKDGHPQYSLAETLHVGTLQKPLPLIGYAPWENHVYFGLAGFILICIALVLTRGARGGDRRKSLRRPDRLQALAEFLVGGFDDFCKGVLGEENGRKYLPFILTLFYLILTCNLMGLVPGLRAPTASIITTLSLALCTFIVVQGTAWIRLGPMTYLHHLAGSPKDAIGWVLSPLFLVLELISDFLAKPLSLSLRLMGNILGKDILLGAFLGMGISLVAVVNAEASHFVGIPLTIPFYFLGLLLSTIQALVFSLLTMIYITMVLPHDHDHAHADHYNYELVGHHDGTDHVEEHTFDHPEQGQHGHGHGHAAKPAAKKVVHEALPS